jgi:ubiquinone biosynthesis protein UbiJ
MKLPVPFALALQSGFNRLIALDEESKQRLERLQHKLLQIEVTTLDLNIFLLFHSDRVEVLEEFAGDADATIKGPPFSMLALAGGRSDVSNSAVEITGDVETAQQVSRMLQQIDIDWEEHFSKLTGDAVAHQLGNIARGIQRFATRTRDSMQSNTADYLRDETGHLPHDWELESFSNDVDDLRDRVSQLERRILALQPQSANGQQVSDDDRHEH